MTNNKWFFDFNRKTWHLAAPKRLNPSQQQKHLVISQCSNFAAHRQYQEEIPLFDQPKDSNRRCALCESRTADQHEERRREERRREQEPQDDSFLDD